VGLFKWLKGVSAKLISHSDSEPVSTEFHTIFITHATTKREWGQHWDNWDKNDKNWVIINDWEGIPRQFILKLKLNLGLVFIVNAYRIH
jgi:hypothetical protein